MYVDPGSGSVILQILLASVVGTTMVFFRRFLTVVQRLTRKFRK
jgi:hypothetical protein